MTTHKHIPRGWQVRRLGSLMQESRIAGNTGASARKLTLRLYGKGVIPNARSLPGSENTKYFRRRAGQFIFSKLDFLNGAFAIVPEHLDGWETTADLPAFDLSEEVDARWLLAYIARPEFYSAFASVSVGGRKARRVAPTELLATEVLVPPLSEQCRIAEVLASIDEAVVANTILDEEISYLEESILAPVLTGDTPTDSAEELAPGRRRVYKRIEDLCTLSNGNGFRPPDWAETGLPIIRIQNLNGSRIFNYFSGTPKDKWLIEEGDLLFAWAGVQGVSFGPCIWNGPRGVLNQHIFKIIPNTGVNKLWLYFVLRLITKRVEAKAHGFKASLLHVHKSEITGQEVPVPPLSEQKHVASRLQAIIEARTQAASVSKRLVELKSAVASDLLTGRRRVTDTMALAAE